MIRIASLIAAWLCAALQALPASARETPPPGGQALRMEVVGYTAMEGRRGPFKMAIKRVGERWYLYTGHESLRGWSVVDVTDPRAPRLLRFIPSPPEWASWTTGQVTLHGNLMITALNNWAGWGPSPPRPAPAVILWDLSDPEDPKPVSQWQGGAVGSHRNTYPGGRYAYLSTSVPGYRKNLIVVLDVSDPKAPREAGRWWMPGQKDDEPRAASMEPSFHGPVNLSPDGRMASIGYAPSVVNLDMSDPTQPRLIGELRMVPPFPDVGAQSLHTVLPLWDRRLLFVSSEPLKQGCVEGLHFAALVDNADPRAPRLLSLFPRPLPPPGAPYKDFCDKGGRFGPHNTNQEIHLPDVEQPGNLVYLTYFNAGLRVYDIADPRQPTEVAWFLPPERPDAEIGRGFRETRVNWTEDVLVDTRGYIYITDLKWGLWVLRYTGPGQPAPTARP